jgi:hypothetical protein
MYGPEEFHRGFRDLPDKSDPVLKRRRRAHHIRTQPLRDPLPHPITGHQRLILRYLKTGELYEAANELELDWEDLRSRRRTGERSEDWLTQAEYVFTEYYGRLYDLLSRPRWSIYPEIAEQFRVRAAQEAIFRPRHFWNWPPRQKW